MTETITLPGVSTPLSRLVLGTMTFGDTAGTAEAASMLDAALDAGITGIDTANGYAGGAAETMLKELLGPRRDQVVLATKAGIPHPDAGAHAPLSAQGLRASLEGSLRRLGVDSVDVYYLHQPDRSTPLTETLSTIAEFVDKGLVKALGVSNFAAWQIAEINHLADDLSMPRPVVAQQLYNLVARRIEDEYLEFAQVSGILTMVYNPLAGGLLTGLHTYEDHPTSGRFGDSRVAETYKRRYWTPELFGAVRSLAQVAGAAGIPLPALALRWLLSKPGAGAVLLGGSNVAHLRANLSAAAEGPLPADVVAACDDVGATLRGPMPAYNR
ncbi:aldo/keto reductase [Actinopolymorpha alba]|uniref:aldo/keto reductase n=1 Tax=Actinopolymorpha alba TaxID=533267 RepID=UPI000376B668|nr:aldo/keto reductase [Actinopolymorpha alba]